MRDLSPGYDFLVSMANNPEREKCVDTIHELALHNTERALNAEALIRELVETFTPLHPLSTVEYWQEAKAVLVKAKEVLGDD